MTIAKFLANNLRYYDAVSAVPAVRSEISSKDATHGKPNRTTRTRIVDNFSFSFEGKTYPANSAREVVVKVFQLLANTDASFLDRFASRKHGKKRRYIAREKTELYPGRPDLAEKYSIEIVPGWWMGTNYSRGNIQQILDLVLEVVEPRYRSSLQVKVNAQ